MDIIDFEFIPIENIRPSNATVRISISHENSARGEVLTEQSKNMGETGGEWSEISILSFSMVGRMGLDYLEYTAVSPSKYFWLLFVSRYRVSFSFSFSAFG